MMVAGFDIVLITTIILFVLCIIELGLTAYIASEGGSSSPDSINFTLFCAVWSPLVLFYAFFSPKFVPQLYHKWAAAGLLAATTIFWFAAAIATAAFLGTPPFCSRFSVCRTFQAAIAFAWFTWMGFTAVTVLELLKFRREDPSAFQLRGKSVSADASVDPNAASSVPAVGPTYPQPQPTANVSADPVPPVAPPAAYSNQPPVAGQPQQPPYPN